MSVKELMKTFQTGHDPSKTKEGLFENKVVDSCFLEKREQSPTKGSKSHIQTQNLTISSQESDVELCDKTHLEDGSVSFISDNSEESLLISGNAYVEKTVKLTDSIPWEDEGNSLQGQARELSEKETMSVQELMKTFQNGQEPSKHKSELFEQRTVASSHISTLKSELASSEEIQSPEQIPAQELKSQTQELSNIKILENTDLKDRPVRLIEGNTEESMLIPEEAYGEKIEKIAHTVSWDNGISSPKGETPELSQKETMSVKDLIKTFQTGHDPSKVKSLIFEQQAKSFCISTSVPESGESEEIQMTEESPTKEQISQIQAQDPTVFNQLEEPVMSTGRSLAEDIQISPDRRPSEDFSADIKAELEDSPEYQLFKQTSTASDLSYQLEAPEEGILANTVSISGHCVKSYFGEGVSLVENQIRHDDSSPESPKHEAMAESLNISVDINTSPSSSEKSENFKGPVVTHQKTNEIDERREEKYNIPSQEDKFHEASNEITTTDSSCKMFSAQTDTKAAEIKIEEPQLQEVYIERKTSNQATAAVKDMSGMLSLMNSDLDQYLQARPIASQTPEEDIVKEKFEQIIVTKEIDKEIPIFVTRENKGHYVKAGMSPVHCPHDCRGG